MKVNVYRHNDRGAPALSGSVGGALTALTTVLEIGYPSASVTITRSGSTATASHTAHGFMDYQEVTISGAVEPEYNGRVRISYIDANSYSYEVTGTPTTPATGTILAGGEKTVGTTTLTRSGLTVTAACTGHGFSVGEMARIVGANEMQYNGWWEVATTPDADTYTYALWPGYAPDTPATGTIVSRYGKCGAGWSPEYSGTNKKAWKQGARGSLSQMYLRADQSHATYHQKCIQLMMVDSMTGIDTLTNPAYADYNPQKVGQWISGSNDATARDWVIAADDRTVIMMNRPEEAGDAAATTHWTLSYFGDMIDYVDDSAYPQACCAGIHAGSSGYHLSSSPPLAGYAGYFQYGSHGLIQYSSLSGGYSDNGHPWRMLRHHDGSATYMVCRIRDPLGIALCLSDSPGTYSSLGNFVDSSGTPTSNVDEYPDDLHGGINMAHVLMISAHDSPGTGSDVVRGELKGVWSPHHRRPAGWASGDLFRGSGQLAGKLFEVFFLNGVNNPWLVLEISDTWED